MKDQIEKLNIIGKIYAWKYLENTRNYPGWNFTVDRKASESLFKLLNLMEKCEWSSKKEIQASIPTENQTKVPNNQNGSAKWKAASKVIFNLKKTAEKQYWEVIEKETEIEIQFGENKLVEFEKAITGIPNGKGDFAISNDFGESILYFWWNGEN